MNNGRYTLVQQPIKIVAHYTYEMPVGFYRLVKVYPFVAETKNHVQVRHWYGKRWHPKNEYWRVEEL